MDKAQFWQLIEQSKNKAGDCEKQAAKLEKLLSKLSAEEILAFENIFTSLLVESYSWDLWAVAYIVNGGCSDDGFEYFRRWLVAQGQTYYEAALLDPERAADAANPEDPEENECEEIFYATHAPYESKTGVAIGEVDVGEVDVGDAPDYPTEPTGQPWKESDLEIRFPTLCEKFG